MKKLSWKKWALATVAIGIVVAGVFYLNGTKSAGQPSSSIDPAFGEYVSSYTSGVVASNASLRIILAKDAVDSSSIGQETSVKLFSLSPSAKGKTIWVDRRTVEYIPEERLTSGQIYQVSFALSKLFDVPEPLSDFAYSFQVIPQNFEVSIQNIKPYVKTELTRQKVEGILYTADFAEAASIEKTTVASQDGNALKISWTHGGDGKEHAFIIENVARKEAASLVNVLVDGAALGLSNKQEKQVEIPALGDFKIMNAKVIQNPAQYAVLQFSDPLKEKQNLAGLISLGDDNNVTLDFEIHDNEIWVYPSTRVAGTQTIFVEAGIRNINDYKMDKPSSIEVIFEQLKPAVRFIGKGNILPSTDGLILPIEAVNLRAVDVSISKVFENNIPQFLQVNSIQGNYELHRVAKRIVNKTIRLDNAGITDLGKWNRFTLDLSTLINTEPGAIYQVKLDFNQEYVSYICDGKETNTETTLEETTSVEEGEEVYEEDYSYYDEGYDWEQRDNPCHKSFYYDSRSVTRNILASDLGIITKRGDDKKTMVIVNNLKTTEPLSGVTIEYYDFQQQLMGTATTDADGKAMFESDEQPFLVIAKNGNARGYQRLMDGESLSLSGFDVSGESLSRGLKGFLYGERGVWRPGDSLYLSFILEDKNKTLPEGHPVVFELQNPQGVVTSKLIRSGGENGFYRFATSTNSDAPTGNWTARVNVGGAQFYQNIKIETVKPNRLKINLDFGDERITGENIIGKLNVKWLHGAPGKNLKGRFDVTLSRGSTYFKGYDDYNFEDQSREFETEKQEVWEGFTDTEGNASFNTNLSSTSKFPGFMNAVFTGKVFEESGNFSVDRISLPFYPHSSYAGIKLPKGEPYTGMLYTDTDHKVEVAFLDVDGKPVTRSNAEIVLHKLNRYWWWDNSYSSIATYIEQQSSTKVANGKVNAINGKASWTFKVHPADWGTYYIQVCDPVSGHCSGQMIYMDQPGYYGRYSREQKGGATLLTFTSDKTTYNVGDKVNVTIPGSRVGRALVSIENGSRVLKTLWVETKEGDTQFSIDATAEMTPNVFVHVSLLQPHAQTVNDLPIRLYGVIPIGVEDPETRLSPVIQMAEELEPGKEVRIKVSEKNKKKMTFTLAVVDEGLLDITKYKTPEPWKRFYAREALGVKTWDIYDAVMGAFGGRVERLLSIGGDEEGGKEEDPRANRFKPVVKYFGPITIDAGDTEEIRFTMPNYIGSVKTMLVAGYEGAYGHAENVTPVRKPLMVLATLPRVLGPEEKVRLPITLFTQNKSIKSAKVEVSVSGPVLLSEGASRTVDLTNGDVTVDFNLSVKSTLGLAKVKVKASSGSFESTDEIEIDIRNPNPRMSQALEAVVEAGKTWNGTIIPVGMAGTNAAMLEVSSIPPLNLGNRLYYLMEYPHGCVEQTTSAAFPQLYLDVVKELDETERNRVKQNITAGIERLKQFITNDGGFSYWPGNENSDSWVTSYAGHFLIEAEAKGYYVPSDMTKRWKKYQKTKALEWRKSLYQDYGNSEFIQAYRLYTLAMSGSPEMSAMNRLRETSMISQQAKWLLAAAYAKAGQPEAAKTLVKGLTMEFGTYQELGYTYGSDLRDKAMVLEVLTLLNEKTKGFELMKQLSKALSNDGYWMSTQTIAFSLKAIGGYVGTDKREGIRYRYGYNGKTVDALSAAAVSQVNLPVQGVEKNSISITNDTKGMLFARVLSSGIPVRGVEEEKQNNLVIQVAYATQKGEYIDVTKLEQGTEFVATVSVKNPGLRGHYMNLALTQIFPAGWEINNLRINNDEASMKTDRGDYQDIRDDRVYTYFDLSAGQTRTFKVLLTAGYAGTFYLPAVSCEAMYDNSIYARTKGFEVSVVKPNNP